MNDEAIRKQSEAAYNQWKEQWREHAQIHSGYSQRPLSNFENVGVGKAVLCVANGYSFEENIETIKKLQHNVDILCCDKTLGHLLDHGITPTYCMVCDANVDYEKYLRPWEDQLGETILFNNVCGNPTWTQKGNWKSIYFFINKDIIHSHLEFAKLSGCKNFIPAGTNVSNAMLILLTQSDNEGRKNFFGYDKIILIGYDYSWKFDGKYYAFNEDGDGKAMYMKHSYAVAPSGAFIYTSGNLTFSMQWLEKYIRTFNLPVVQCSQDSLLHLGKTSDLAEQMKYQHKPEDGYRVRGMVNELKRMEERMNMLKSNLTKIGKDHWWAHARTV